MRRRGALSVCVVLLLALLGPGGAKPSRLAGNSTAAGARARAIVAAVNPVRTAHLLPTLAIDFRLSRGGRPDPDCTKPRMRLRLVPFEQFAQLGDLLLAQVVPLAALDPVDELPDERRQLDGIERLRHVVDTAEVDSLRAIPDLGAG